MHRTQMDAVQKTLNVDGDVIAYAVSGNGPAVLLIQGVGVAGTGWMPQVRALCPSFTAITCDNRGVGGSAAGRAPLSIERMAADALAIMDAEGVDRFHVVGHSMGGLIAQALALSARERVKSLSLLCTFADGRDGSRLSPALMLLGLRTRIGTRRMRRAAMLRLIMPAGHLRAVDRMKLCDEMAGLFGHDLGDHPAIVGAQLRAMSSYAATARLAELSGVPTLVLSAAHDLIAPPRLGRALAGAIGTARFVEFPEAGHAMPIQCAAGVNALLLEHLTAAESGTDGVRAAASVPIGIASDGSRI